MATSQDFVNWVCGEALLPEFLRYLLMAEQESIRRFAFGSVHQTMYYPDAKALYVCIPTIDEQRAIAAVLGALDDKIAANIELASTASGLAVTHVATAPASCLVEEIATLERATVSPATIDATSIPHYSLPAFDEGALPSIDAPTDIKSSKFWMDSPRVLVSKLNPRILRVWAVDQETGLPALASTEFMPLASTEVSYTLLWATVSAPDFGRRLEAQVAGTSGSHQRVKPDDLMSTFVSDPRSLAAPVQELVAALVALAIQTRVESKTLADLRDTLLPALMSGRLRVKDAEQKIADAV